MEAQHLTHGFRSPFETERWFAEEHLRQLNGFWIPQTLLSSTQHILSNFRPNSADVILASFPKTGTTWLKSLLFALIHRSSKQSLAINSPHDLIPTMEVQSFLPDTTYTDFPSVINPNINGSRIYSTHIPYQILADNLNSSACKIVYVTREPKDTLISMWHFMNKKEETDQTQTEEPIWPIDKAVEQFCNGMLSFGPYYDHVLGYHKQSVERPEKVFFITYEELRNDPHRHVKRLAEFLGVLPLEGGDGDGDKEIDEIVKSCSFEKLRNHDVNKSSSFIRNFLFPRSGFFRKGEVGDYSCFLVPEMIQKVDAITKEKFQGSGLSFGM